MRPVVWHSSGRGSLTRALSVCSPLASGCCLRLAAITPLVSTLGAPLPTSRALWGAPSSPGLCPNDSDLLGVPGLSLSSVSLTLRIPGLLLGPSPPAPCRLSQDRRRDAQDPTLVLLSGPMLLECLMPVSWEPSVGALVLVVSDEKVSPGSVTLSLLGARGPFP